MATCIYCDGTGTIASDDQPIPRACPNGCRPPGPRPATLIRQPPTFRRTVTRDEGLRRVREIRETLARHRPTEDAISA
jgi:hypothetical protein